MTQKNGSPPLYLVASTPEPRDPKLALHAASMLEECREMLIEGGELDTVKLLDIALLQLRMSLRGISDAELKELCAALTRQDEAVRICDGA